jgi:polyisoprenyl-teichoic acid--peptidoglycan teichoic acid transferase
MRRFGRTLCLLCCLSLVCRATAAVGESAYTNPLLNPNTVSAYTELPEDMLNILLLGIDYGHKGYLGSGAKNVLEECHTDAMLVVSIHQDSKKIDLVSLPRDTLTYVPGIRGIYKLNAAVNCGETEEDGLQKACDAASWLLGGVKIDYYCAVDMNVMETLGDALGGVDFELEMSYTGHSGKKYAKGLTHLDGTGIVDYLRSRNNATVNSNDIGRTARQRELMTAIFQKLKADYSLMIKVFKVAMDNADGFFTNIPVSGTSLVSAISYLKALNAENIGSYVITGKYRTALKGWNFTFTDQENRQSVIREVYGIDVAPLAYVDYDYTQWLMESGFRTIHLLWVAQELQTYLLGLDDAALSQEGRQCERTFLDAVTATQDAFETAAVTMDDADTQAMIAARDAMKSAGEAAAEQLGYPDKLLWTTGKYWYTDPYINEVQLNWK